MNGLYSTGLAHSIRSIADIPIGALQAELIRRQDGQDAGEDQKPSCGSTRSGTYNTPIHVMALFLILVLSTLGMDLVMLVFVPPCTVVTDTNWPMQHVHSQS